MLRSLSAATSVRAYALALMTADARDARCAVICIRLDSPASCGWPAADGLWMSSAGVLYLTSPSDFSIKRLSGDATQTVLADRGLRWPDTVSEGPDGTIYVTASHIQDTVWFKPNAQPSITTPGTVRANVSRLAPPLLAPVSEAAVAVISRQNRN